MCARLCPGLSCTGEYKSSFTKHTTVKLSTFCGDVVARFQLGSVQGQKKGPSVSAQSLRVAQQYVFHYIDGLIEIHLGLCA